MNKYLVGYAISDAYDGPLGSGSTVIERDRVAEKDLADIERYLCSLCRTGHPRVVIYAVSKLDADEEVTK